MGVKGGEPPIYMPTLSRASTRQSTEAQQDELPHYDDDNDSVAAPTFLQPRVAAVLGVSEGWHPVLFACRLLSIVPSILYGVPITFQFLAKLHSIIMAEDGAEQGKWSFENRFLLTESFLAIGWVGLFLDREKVWLWTIGGCEVGLHSKCSAGVLGTSPFSSQTVSCPDGKQPTSPCWPGP